MVWRLELRHRVRTASVSSQRQPPRARLACRSSTSAKTEVAVQRAPLGGAVCGARGIERNRENA